MPKNDYDRWQNILFAKNHFAIRLHHEDKELVWEGRFFCDHGLHCASDCSYRLCWFRGTQWRRRRSRRTARTGCYHLGRRL